MPNLTEVARPYAQAAFEYAMSKQQVPHWSKTLHLLAQITRQPEAQRLLQDPKFTPTQRADAMVALLEETLDVGDRNFIKLLAEGNRLNALADIARLFDEFRAESEKIKEAKVTSVVELSEDYKKELAEKLSKRFGYKIILQCHLDPNLIGGLLIHVDNTAIDNSVRGQFLRLEEKLAA